MTVSELLRLCREKFNRIEVRYAHPTLYIIVIDNSLDGKSEEDRRSKLLANIELEEVELTKLENSSGVSVELVSEAEFEFELSFLSGREKDTHWLPLMDEKVRNSLPVLGPEQVNAIHFYGFKGGQARSTVLALLAKLLASEGYKILVVDVDIEAPSLDLLFDSVAFDVGTTLMGLCGWSDTVEPVTAFAPLGKEGKIDVIACRPRSENYDMDFAAFAVRASLDISIIREGIAKLKQHVLNMSTEQRYDLVLFDHRTGIAPSVLPALREWRGPTVVFVRPDGLSMQAENTFASLFSQNPENPGAFVSFSLDFDEGKTAKQNLALAPVQQLLQTLSEAIARGAEADASEVELLPPESLENYWVSWYADRALLTSVSPQVEMLLKVNIDSLRQLRDVLGITKAVDLSAMTIPREYKPRSPSGAVDQGWFIETPEINRLFLPHSTISYVTGRKGTGKTRIYKEMVKRGLGEPMFSAADFQGGGILSNSPLQHKLLDACEGDFRKFWWALLGICLESPSEHTEAQDGWEQLVTDWCNLPQAQRDERSTSYYASKAYAGRSKRTFLIDGIETAVPSSRLREFVEELLLFMLTIQSDSKLSAVVFVRLFLRADLLQASAQNIEQQTSLRRLELRWDSDGIFNFVLARIEQSAWFNKHFPPVCHLIGEKLDDIRAGRLGPSEYEPLLLSIFPKKLRRNNIQTITFFDSYFSDAGGDSKEGASFYPRLFEEFVHNIALISQAREDKKQDFLENGRLMHGVVLEAHAEATQTFIDGVTQELHGSLELDEDARRNAELVKQMIDSFEGLTTPFKFEETAQIVSGSIGGIDQNKVRAALQRMRDVGIFEAHPNRPGQWRAGRLYKSALRMKYQR
ncbi:MinD/ParA family protein [Azotobacter salinestris]